MIDPAHDLELLADKFFLAFVPVCFGFYEEGGAA
jgi:hypothetical protein